MFVLSLAFAAMQLAASSLSGELSSAARPRSPCFSLSDWSGWKALDDRTLLLRLRGRDVYRIDLAHETSLLRSPGARLVSVVQGGEQVCRPIDLDLRVSDTAGSAVPIQAKSIRRLSEAEVEALPPSDRP